MASMPFGSMCFPQSTCNGSAFFPRRNAPQNGGPEACPSRGTCFRMSVASDTDALQIRMPELQIGCYLLTVAFDNTNVAAPFYARDFYLRDVLHLSVEPQAFFEV